MGKTRLVLAAAVDKALQGEDIVIVCRNADFARDMERQIKQAAGRVRCISQYDPTLDMKRKVLEGTHSKVLIDNGVEL
jgi:hypothetical protein